MIVSPPTIFDPKGIGFLTFWIKLKLISNVKRKEKR